MGVILAVVALAAICSSAASRREGREAARPWGYLAGVLTAIIVAAVVFLPRRGS